MQRTLSLRTAIIGAIVLALGAGGLIYALNQYITDRNTGLFTVDIDEAAALNLEFFVQTPGGGSTAGTDWCEGSVTGTQLHCVAKVSSTTTTITQDVALAVTAAAPGAGDLRDDLTLAVYRIASADGAVRDACRAGSLAGWTQILAPTALGLLPATTPYALGPAASGHVCFVVAYTGDGFGSTPGAITTSASLRVTGTAQ